MSLTPTRHQSREFVFLSLALVILGADQLTKFLVRNHMAVGESIPESWFIRITYIQNTGGAFGLFANQTIFLTIAAIIGICVIGYFFIRGSRFRFVLRLSLALQMGGALGNVIDRLTFGYVIDFIDIRVWPIFNVADSSITIGFFLLVWTLIMGSDRKGKNRYGSKSQK